MSAPEGSVPTPIALWAVPRSLSTAFEQMMRARGDLEVLYEPFHVYYYFSTDRVTDHFKEKKDPDPSFHYEKVVERILTANSRDPVFFKDMAYHLSRCMNPELAGSFTNTFLIRHPRWVLPSLYRLHPNCTLEETGFDQQLRLMRMVESLTEGDLVVVDAEELRDSPEQVARDYCEAVGLPFVRESLHWEAGGVEEWATFEEWHSEATQSTGFEPRLEEQPDLSNVPEDVYGHCARVFEEISSFKTRRVAS